MFMLANGVFALRREPNNTGGGESVAIHVGRYSGGTVTIQVGRLVAIHVEGLTDTGGRAATLQVGRAVAIQVERAVAIQVGKAVAIGGW